jgi:hypothetical protein
MFLHELWSALRSEPAEPRPARWPAARGCVQTVRSNIWHFRLNALGLSQLTNRRPRPCYSTR